MLLTAVFSPTYLNKNVLDSRFVLGEARCLILKLLVHNVLDFLLGQTLLLSGCLAAGNQVAEEGQSFTVGNAKLVVQVQQVAQETVVVLDDGQEASLHGVEVAFEQHLVVFVFIYVEPNLVQEEPQRRGILER